MSCSLNIPAILINGFCRVPPWKVIQFARQVRFMLPGEGLGDSGLTLLPSMPRHALQVAALAWPASFEPLRPVQPSAAAKAEAAASFAVI